jgi:hypothetical protein
MHEPEKSDSVVVAGKPTNKAERSAAEPVEHRAPHCGRNETSGHIGFVAYFEASGLLQALNGITPKSSEKFQIQTRRHERWTPGNMVFPQTYRTVRL